jgi:hypothetical protein
MYAVEVSRLSIVYGLGFESLSFRAHHDGGVVHGRGFESFTFGGQWWPCTLSWVRIFDVWVNGRGFESLTFDGVSGGVVRGRGFESLTFEGVSGGVVLHALLQFIEMEMAFI